MIHLKFIIINRIIYLIIRLPPKSRHIEVKLPKIYFAKVSLSIHLVENGMQKIGRSQTETMSLTRNFFDASCDVSPFAIAES